MYERILVATDFSDSADEALRQAARLAERDGAKLALCHAMPELQPVDMLFPQRTTITSMEAADLERRAAEALVERATAVIGRAADGLSTFVERGTDYAAVVERAEAWRADLVVVGSHGRTGLKRALLGSVAERVVRYAQGPVLVARPGALTGPVVAATDLSDPSLPAIRAAAAEAGRRGSELVVVHAIESLSHLFVATAGAPFGGSWSGIDADALRSIRDAARTALAGALESVGEKATPEVVEGDAASSIVARAEALGAQLVVVATHGRTGLARVALGSVAEKVVRHAPCSVLVVRLRA